MTLEVRQYCYHILLDLVMVHAAVGKISRHMQVKVMQGMVINLAQELLHNIRFIDCFSGGGMLQATLETEFLESQLKSYETPISAKLFGQVYDTIEKLTNAADSNQMTENLQLVRKFLQEARNATGVQFQCFKEPKS
jgi:exocyst complex component 2